MQGSPGRSAHARLATPGSGAREAARVAGAAAGVGDLALRVGPQEIGDHLHLGRRHARVAVRVHAASVRGVGQRRRIGAEQLRRIARVRARPAAVPVDDRRVRVRVALDPAGCPRRPRRPASGRRRPPARGSRRRSCAPRRPPARWSPGGRRTRRSGAPRAPACWPAGCRSSGGRSRSGRCDPRASGSSTAPAAG